MLDTTSTPAGQPSPRWPHQTRKRPTAQHPSRPLGLQTTHRGQPGRNRHTTQRRHRSPFSRDCLTIGNHDEGNRTAVQPPANPTVQHRLRTSTTDNSVTATQTRTEQQVGHHTVNTDRYSTGGTAGRGRGLGGGTHRDRGSSAGGGEICGSGSSDAGGAAKSVGRKAVRNAVAEREAVTPAVAGVGRRAVTDARLSCGCGETMLERLQSRLR